MKFDTFLAVAAGALAYHMYRKIQNLEEIVVGIVEGQVVQLDKASFDISDQVSDTEDGQFKFGFN